MKYSRLVKAAVPIKANVLFYDSMGRHIDTISQLPLPYSEEDTENFWTSSISNTKAVGSVIVTELFYQNLMPPGFAEINTVEEFAQNGDIGYIGFSNGNYINFVITGGW